MTAEKPASVTENELATALRTTLFPVPDRPGWGEGELTLSDLAGVTSAEAADVLFKHVAARKAEAARWIIGDLYMDGSTHAGQIVYQRETGGWRITGSSDRFRDGDLDTRSFRRLIPESRVAGPGPVPFAPPHAFVPPYPAEDGPLKGDLFPEFEVRTGDQDEAARFTQMGTAPPPLGSQGPELRAHNHEGDGTVEGCRGCFPATGPGRELAAGDQRLRAMRATEGEH